MGNDATGAWLNVTIGVNGVDRALRIPAQIDVAPEEAKVTGEVTLTHTDFGIVPYSILAGALQVQDPVAIRFRIRAWRLPT